MLFDDVVKEMAACLDLGRVDSSYHRRHPGSFLAHFSVRSIAIGLVVQPLTIVRTVMRVVTLKRETIMENSLLVASANKVISAYCFDSYSAHASIAFDVVVTDLVELYIK